MTLLRYDRNSHAKSKLEDENKINTFFMHYVC